jgi:hypothetical protein
MHISMSSYSGFPALISVDIPVRNGIAVSGSSGLVLHLANGVSGTLVPGDITIAGGSTACLGGSVSLYLGSDGTERLSSDARSRSRSVLG